MPTDINRLDKIKEEKNNCAEEERTNRLSALQNIVLEEFLDGAEISVLERQHFPSEDDFSASIIKCLKKAGINFLICVESSLTGVLKRLILTKNGGPKVVNMTCKFRDPETPERTNRLSALQNIVLEEFLDGAEISVLERQHFPSEEDFSTSIIKCLKKAGINFLICVESSLTGVLCARLILTKNGGPKVVNMTCKFRDPETPVLERQHFPSEEDFSTSIIKCLKKAGINFLICVESSLTEELNLEFEGLTGETVNDVMVLTGKEINLENVRMLLHFSILQAQANLVGAPKGKALRESSNALPRSSGSGSTEGFSFIATTSSTGKSTRDGVLIASTGLANTGVSLTSAGSAVSCSRLLTDTSNVSGIDN
ncbi:unnamed protein product [Mytilus edulis]|uniref:Uncharacterized protein n=1 Tax=Mytilus edulis TaxID=6550 RepID=A0A8S3UK83_MYTED|nr:unnamed protein product [Mytilus edulis]